jgi:hypothetical protein
MALRLERVDRPSCLPLISVDYGGDGETANARDGSLSEVKLQEVVFPFCAFFP